MFIATRRRRFDLRKEVHIFCPLDKEPRIFESVHSLPSQPLRPLASSMMSIVVGTMDLLTEVGSSAHRYYKHGPPGGGRSITEWLLRPAYRQERDWTCKR